MPFNRGVLLEKVFPDSPAYFSNLAPGDVIIKYGEQMVYSQNQLRGFIMDADPEEKAWLTVYRNGSYYNVMLELGQKPTDRSLPARAAAAVAQQANPAPPILSCAPERHKFRGVCINCHVINAPQANSAPPILSGAPERHKFRGVCINCHVISDRNQGQAALNAAPAALTPPGGQGAWQQMPGMNAPGANPISPLTEFTWSGVALETLGPGGAVEIGLPANTTGVAVDEVVLGSQGDRGGVRAGDLIREINGFAVYDAQSFANVVQNQQLSGGVLLVNRNGRSTYVTVPEF